MQIHELPAGSPASGLQFAGDTGSQTQKIDYDALANAILSKLTTKTFDIKSESQTIIAALNALGDASKQGVANDLVTTAAGLVLDARQGKALKDLHDTNASDIATLNGKLYTEYTLTPNSEYISDVYTNSAILIGKVCFIRSFFYVSKSAAQGARLFTVPLAAAERSDFVITTATGAPVCGGYLGVNSTSLNANGGTVSTGYGLVSGWYVVK